jgi:hypothetical protein
MGVNDMQISALCIVLKNMDSSARRFFEIVLKDVIKKTAYSGNMRPVEEITK